MGRSLDNPSLDITDDEVDIGDRDLVGNSLAWNEQTGTTYTFTLADNGKVVRLSNASAITATIPQESTEVLPQGFRCYVVQGGAGTVTFAKEGSNTIESDTSKLDIAGQHRSACIIKRTTGASAAWLLMGDLAA